MLDSLPHMLNPLAGRRAKMLRRCAKRYLRLRMMAARGNGGSRDHLDTRSTAA
jgi:hypothetical protein